MYRPRAPTKKHCPIEQGAFQLVGCGFVGRPPGRARVYLGRSFRDPPRLFWVGPAHLSWSQQCCWLFRVRYLPPQDGTLLNRRIQNTPFLRVVCLCSRVCIGKPGSRGHLGFRTVPYVQERVRPVSGGGGRRQSEGRRASESKGGGASRCCGGRGGEAGRAHLRGSWFSSSPKHPTWGFPILETFLSLWLCLSIL